MTDYRSVSCSCGGTRLISESTAGSSFVCPMCGVGQIVPALTKLRELPRGSLIQAPSKRSAALPAISDFLAFGLGSFGLAFLVTPADPISLLIVGLIIFALTLGMFLLGYRRGKKDR